MKPRGDGGAADGKMPAQLGSCAGIAFPRCLAPGTWHSTPRTGHPAHAPGGPA